MMYPLIGLEGMRERWVTWPFALHRIPSHPRKMSGVLLPFAFQLFRYRSALTSFILNRLITSTSLDAESWVDRRDTRAEVSANRGRD